MSVDGIQDTIFARLNPTFSNSREIVVRKTDFVSDRTLGVRCDKAAFDLKSEIIEKLKNPETILGVEIRCKKDN